MTDVREYADNPLTGKKDIVNGLSTTAANGLMSAADKTTHDSSRKSDTNLLDFIPTDKWPAILDGTSGYDASADFDSAIAAVSTKGGNLVLPPGKINVSNTIIIGNATTGQSSIHGVKLVGAGGALYSGGGSVIKWIGAAGGTVLRYKGPGAGYGLDGVRIDCANSAANGIEAYSIRQSTFNDFVIQDFTGVGLDLKMDPTNLSLRQGILNTFSQFSISSTATTGTIGIRIDGDYIGGYDWYKNTFSAGSVYVSAGLSGNIAYGIYLKFCDSNTFTKVDAEIDNTSLTLPGAQGYGVAFDAQGNTAYPQNNIFYACSLHDTVVYESGGDIVTQNFFDPYLTADGEEIPTHPALKGVTDTFKHFGASSYQTVWAAPNTANITTSFDSYGDQGRAIVRTANGTPDAPTKTLSGGIIGQVGMRGHDGTSFSTASRAAIIAQAAEDFTPTAQGADLQVRVTPIGAVVANQAFTVFHDSHVRIGQTTTSPAKTFEVEGDASITGTGGLFLSGVGSGITFQDGTSITSGVFSHITAAPGSHNLANSENGSVIHFTGAGSLYLDYYTAAAGSIAVYNSSIGAVSINPNGNATGTTLDGSTSVATLGVGQGIILSKTGSLTWATIAKTSGGTVTSVFGRTGTVVKASGDYAKADVTGLADTDYVTFVGATLQSNTVNPLIVSRAGGGASITLQTSSGTLASPTAVTSGMGIGNIQVLGATGAGTWDGSPRNSYRVEAEELWTTSTGAYGLAFHSRAAGALGLSTEKMRISGTGLQTFKNGGGIPHGHMYSNTSTTITVSAMGTWYEVDTGATDFTAGLLLNVTQTDHYLTVATAGRYKVDWHMDITSTTAGDKIAGTVMVNGVATETAHGHTTVPSGTTAVSTCGFTILQLAANDQVSLAVENHSGARNITMEHAQLVLTYVGN